MKPSRALTSLTDDGWMINNKRTFCSNRRQAGHYEAGSVFFNDQTDTRARCAARRTEQNSGDVKLEQKTRMSPNWTHITVCQDEPKHVLCNPCNTKVRRGGSTGKTFGSGKLSACSHRKRRRRRARSRELLCWC